MTERESAEVALKRAMKARDSRDRLTAVESADVYRLLHRLEEALERIAAGPYNGFEQCKAIAEHALSTDSETKER